MPTNNFLEFCPTDTGTNLPSQAAYSVDADRTSGNKPGIASSALNNKALRQANFITSQIAQAIANTLGVDVLDDANTTKLYYQMLGFWMPLKYLSRTYGAGSSGNHDLSYVFFCATASADAGATYTNNGVTFTVRFTLAAGNILICTANNIPSVSGTLTKSAGSGDATITFYSYRAPTILECQITGGGGGGGGSGTISAGTGGTGGNSTFGATIFVGNGGNGGSWSAVGGFGGTASNTAGGQAFTGGHGSSGVSNFNSGSGGLGGCGMINQPGPIVGAAGGASNPGAPGGTGCGGSGATGHAGTSVFPGSGGAAGGWCNGYIYNPTGTYAYVVGAGGTAGTAGTSGAAGGAGGGGLLIVKEIYN